MDMLTVPLTAEQRRYIDERVRAGEFAAPEDVVQAAVERERLHGESYAARARALREAAQVGLDQIARGEGIEVTDIDAFFDEIWREAEAAVHANAPPHRRS